MYQAPVYVSIIRPLFMYALNHAQQTRFNPWDKSNPRDRFNP